MDSPLQNYDFFLSIGEDQLNATLINPTRKEYGCK